MKPESSEREKKMKTQDHRNSPEFKATAVGQKFNKTTVKDQLMFQFNFQLDMIEAHKELAFKLGAAGQAKGILTAARSLGLLSDVEYYQLGESIDQKCLECLGCYYWAAMKA